MSPFSCTTEHDLAIDKSANPINWYYVRGEVGSVTHPLVTCVGIGIEYFDFIKNIICTMMLYSLGYGVSNLDIFKKILSFLHKDQLIQRKF